MLLDFLPHAVSFVFVVNAKNAGGIQEDRVTILISLSVFFIYMAIFGSLIIVFTSNRREFLIMFFYSF